MPHDPKPPTVEEIMAEIKKWTAAAFSYHDPKDTRDIERRLIVAQDALATRARLADSYGAELLAILEVAKRAGGHEVAAEKAMIEMAARVRELERLCLPENCGLERHDDGSWSAQIMDGCVTGVGATAGEAAGELVTGLSMIVEHVKRERDEARGESATRKRIIEQQNTERLAIVEEAQRNDLARREQAETLEAKNTRLRETLAMITKLNLLGPAVTKEVEAILREGRDGKGWKNS